MFLLNESYNHSKDGCVTLTIPSINHGSVFDTGQWGLPTFNAGVFFGMLAIIFCSVIESVGDYYATAAICRLPPPPKDVIGRGIATEGLGCLIGALMGSCHATTSYSQTIGFVGMTRVRLCRSFKYLLCRLIIDGKFHNK